MITLSDLMDLDDLQDRIDQGFVSARNHPTEDLTIYNYTNHCQYSYAGDEVTTQCRGLIVANGLTFKENQIMSRGVGKFFNLSEHLNNPTLQSIETMRPYSVTNKLDGSALVSYVLPSTGKLAWATRGSFESDQAIWANKWWNHHFTEVDLPVEAYTFFAEVIYPENRIVLNYEGKESIVLIGIIDTQTGLQVESHELSYPYDTMCDKWPAEMVQSFQFVPDLSQSNASLPSREATEGYVILMDDRKTRVKVKEEEYVSLHKIISGVSTTAVWKHLKDGFPIKELAEILPDEFYDWIREQAWELEIQHDMISCRAWDDYNECIDSLGEEVTRSNRREFAIMAKTKEYPDLIFSIVDGKPIEEKIWRLIEPQRETPFVNS